MTSSTRFSTMVSCLLTEPAPALKIQFRKTPELKLKLLDFLKKPLPELSDNYPLIGRKVSLIFKKNEIPRWITPYLPESTENPIYNLFDEREYEQAARLPVDTSTRNEKEQTPLHFLAKQPFPYKPLIEIYLKRFPEWIWARDYKNRLFLEVVIDNDTRSQLLELAFPNNHGDQLCYVALFMNDFNSTGELQLQSFFKKLKHSFSPVDYESWLILKRVSELLMSRSKEPLAIRFINCLDQTYPYFATAAFVEWLDPHLFEHPDVTFIEKKSKALIPAQVGTETKLDQWKHFDDCCIHALTQRSLFLHAPAKLTLPPHLMLTANHYFTPSLAPVSPFTASTPLSELTDNFDDFLRISGFIESTALPLEWIESKAEEIHDCLKKNKNSPLIDILCVFGLEKSVAIYNHLIFTKPSNGTELQLRIFRSAYLNNISEIPVKMLKKILNNPGTSNLQQTRLLFFQEVITLLKSDSKNSYELAKIILTHHPIFKFYPLSEQDHQKYITEFRSGEVNKTDIKYFKLAQELKHSFRSLQVVVLINNCNRREYIELLVASLNPPSSTPESRQLLLRECATVSFTKPSRFHALAWNVIITDTVEETLRNHITDVPSLRRVESYLASPLSPLNKQQQTEFWQTTASSFFDNFKNNYYEKKSDTNPKNKLFPLLIQFNRLLNNDLKLNCYYRDIFALASNFKNFEDAEFLFKHGSGSIEIGPETREKFISTELAKRLTNHNKSIISQLVSFCDSQQAVRCEINEDGAIVVFHQNDQIFKGYLTLEKATTLIPLRVLQKEWERFNRYLQTHHKDALLEGSYLHRDWFDLQQLPVAIYTELRTKKCTLYHINLEDGSVAEIKLIFGKDFSTAEEFQAIYEKPINNIRIVAEEIRSKNHYPSTELKEGTFSLLLQSCGIFCIYEASHTPADPKLHFVHGLDTVFKKRQHLLQRYLREISLKGLQTNDSKIIYVQNLHFEDFFHEQFDYFKTNLTTKGSVYVMATDRGVLLGILTVWSRFFAYSNLEDLNENMEKLKKAAFVTKNVKVNRANANLLLAENPAQVIPENLAPHVAFDSLTYYFENLLKDKNFEASINKVDIDTARNNVNNYLCILLGVRLALGWDSEHTRKKEYANLRAQASHIIAIAKKDKNPLEVIKFFIRDLALYGGKCAAQLSELTYQNWSILSEMMISSRDYKGDVPQFCKSVYKKAFLSVLEEIQLLAADEDIIEESIHLDAYLRNCLHKWNAPLSDQLSPAQNDSQNDRFSGTGQEDFPKSFVKNYFPQRLKIFMIERAVEEQKEMIMGNPASLSSMISMIYVYLDKVLSQDNYECTEEEEVEYNKLKVAHETAMREVRARQKAIVDECEEERKKLEHKPVFPLTDQVTAQINAKALKIRDIQNEAKEIRNRISQFDKEPLTHIEEHKGMKRFFISSHAPDEKMELETQLKINLNSEKMEVSLYEELLKCRDIFIQRDKNAHVEHVRQQHEALALREKEAQDEVDKEALNKFELNRFIENMARKDGYIEETSIEHVIINTKGEEEKVTIEVDVLTPLGLMVIFKKQGLFMSKSSMCTD